MANFLGRLLARLQGDKKQNVRRRRRTRARKLRLEPMEMRRLLAGDLGAIEGVAFTDVDDNGTFDVGTDPVLAATFTLFEDTNTNGVFDSGTDAQVGAPQTIAAPADPLANPTPAADMYRFSDLGPNTYFVQQQAITGQLQRTTETVKTVVITDTESEGVQTQNVDTFDTTLTSPDPLSATPGGSASHQATTAGGETIGDERDIVINNDGASSNNIDVNVDTINGELFINTGGSTTGSVIVTYDGADASATTVAHNLGGPSTPVDLTANAGESFYFKVGSEAGNTMTVDVFSGNSADFSSQTIALPVTTGAAPTADLFLDFADFVPDGGGSGADFSAVTAIRIELTLSAASDAAFDFVSVVAPFVETSNAANLNPMSLGNLVFNDPNDNGVFDAGETGISGVEVQLFEDTNANGSFDSGTDTAVGTPQTTDGNGNYLFDDLLPGEYIVLIPISEFATNSDPLFGFASSNNSGNFEPAPDPDLTVTDGDDNGTLIAGVGVATTAITLAAGTEPTTDGDTDNNSDLTIDFGFAPQIDLEVTKTADLSTVTAGNQLTYTITVTNNGPSDAANVVVVDNLPDLSPDPLTIVSAVSGSGNGTVTQTGNSAGEIEVAYATLASGASDTITVVVGVPAGAATAAAVTNTVTVSGEGVETSTANNSDSVDVAIDRQAALQITKTDTPDPIPVGDTLTYEIVVTNNGPSTAENLVIADTLPAGLTFSSVNTTAGTASEASGVITVNVPTLAVSSSVTVTVVSTVDSTFSGSTLSNTATAVSDEASQVSAQADTDVNPQIDLQISKSDSVDPVNRGSQLTYTLSVTNNGPEWCDERRSRRHPAERRHLRIGLHNGNGHSTRRRERCHHRLGQHGLRSNRADPDHG